MAVPLVNGTISANPFVSRTIAVPTAFATEWSLRTEDDAGNNIDPSYIVGVEIFVNAKTLIIYNTDSNDSLAVKCQTAALGVTAGYPGDPTKGKFEDITVTTDYARVPPGGALTVSIGSVGERLLAPWIYVQSMGAGSITCSFVTVQTSGNLNLGGQ
jgi:hypothetical protein